MFYSVDRKISGHGLSFGLNAEQTTEDHPQNTPSVTVNDKADDVADYALTLEAEYGAQYLPGNVP